MRGNRVTVQGHRPGEANIQEAEDAPVTRLLRPLVRVDLVAEEKAGRCPALTPRVRFSRACGESDESESSAKDDDDGFEYVIAPAVCGPIGSASHVPLRAAALLPTTGAPVVRVARSR